MEINVYDPHSMPEEKGISEANFSCTRINWHQIDFTPNSFLVSFFLWQQFYYIFFSYNFILFLGFKEAFSIRASNVVVRTYLCTSIVVLEGRGVNIVLGKQAIFFSVFEYFIFVICCFYVTGITLPHNVFEYYINSYKSLMIDDRYWRNIHIIIQES